MHPAPAPRLIIRRSDGSLVELEWDKPILSIGRDGSNDVIIDHLLASRRHARLERDATGFAVRDLDSTNGTFVNDDRITGLYALHNQDRVVIADTVITFQDPEATVKGTVPPELLGRRSSSQRGAARRWPRQRGACARHPARPAPHREGVPAP